MFGWTWSELPFQIGNIVALVMAGVLLAMSHRSVHARWFAALLITRGLGDGLLGLATLAQSTVAVPLYRLAWFLLVLHIPVTLTFLCLYPRRRAWLRPWHLGALWGASGAILGTILVAPHWMMQVAWDGTLTVEMQPLLGWIAALSLLLGGVVAVVLLHSVASMAAGPRRRAATLLAAAAWFSWSFLAGRHLFLAMATIPDSGASYATWQGLVSTWVHVATLLAGLAILAWQRTARARRWAGLGMAIMAFGVVGMWGSSLSGPLAFLGIIERYGVGAAHSALPIVAAYAILQCSIFDVRFKAKFALRQSTFVTLAGVLFWLASTVLGANLEGYLRLSAPWPDIIAGAVVALFIRPLQTLAISLADRLMPNTKNVTEMDDRERLRFYEEQVTLAFEDRSIGAKERRILDHLRTRLRLPDGAARRVEARITGT